MVCHLRPVTYFQHLFNISQMFGSYAEKNGLEVVRYEKVKNFEELAMGGRNISSQYQRHTPAPEQAEWRDRGGEEISEAGVQEDLSHVIVHHRISGLLPPGWQMQDWPLWVSFA